MKTTTIFPFLLVAVLLVSAGCSSPESQVADAHAAAESAERAFDDDDVIRLWSPEVEYTEHLMSKGHELAKRELGRMAAAEMMYRNKVELQEIDSGLYAPGTGVYLKIYRNFTGYEIEDIYRSESYLYPVAYQIRYTYDLLGTGPAHSSTPDAVKAAEAQNEFSVLGEYSLVRRYRADREGNYVGNLPDLPPRPNFYRPEEGTEGDEPGAALANPMPPGGMMPPGMSPIPPPMQNLSPIPGPTF